MVQGLLPNAITNSVEMFLIVGEVHKNTANACVMVSWEKLLQVF